MKFDLKNFDLNDIDLQSINDLDIREAGNWPLAGQIVLFLVVFVLLVGGGYYFMIRDQYNTLDRITQKESSLKQEFRVKQRKAANLEELRAQLHQIRANFGELLRQLPSKTEVDSLLRDISQTAKVDGLEQKLFQPESEVKKDFYAEKPIQMVVTGKYHQLATFVSDVAALPRIVTLHNISIQPVGDSQSGKLKMTLTAKIYRYLTGKSS